MLQKRIDKNPINVIEIFSSEISYFGILCFSLLFEEKVTFILLLKERRNIAI